MANRRRQERQTLSMLQKVQALFLLYYLSTTNGQTVVTTVAPSIDPVVNGGGSIDPLFAEARRVASFVDASLADTCMLQILARLSPTDTDTDTDIDTDIDKDTTEPPVPYDHLVQRVAADLTTCLVPNAGGSACADRTGPIDACIEALRAEPPAWIAFTSFLATADAHVHRHTETHRRVATLNAYRSALERLAQNLRHVEEVLRTATSKHKDEDDTAAAANADTRSSTYTYPIGISIAVAVVLALLQHRGLGETIVLARATAFLVGSALAAIAVRTFH